MDLEKLISFYHEFAQSSQQDLNQRLQAADLHPGPEFIHAVMPNLMRQLFAISHKVLISQYKVIAANVSFDDFCASLKEAEVRQYLMQRYPVMQFWLVLTCQNWVQQCLLLFQRFHADESRIREQILPGADNLIWQEVKFGMGDTHRGGQSVAKIRFASGAQLLYKPRSLQIDLHFTQLVDWVNTHCPYHLQIPRTIHCGDYGWVEFVHGSECTEQAEVDLYYQRLGAWLAILYVLEGTDFHYENIIAAGPHPVLIDLESFFHPEVPVAGSESNESFDNSVLRTGILPNTINLDDAGLPDISGIADVEGKEGVVENLVMVRAADGNIHFERQKGSLQGAQNVPVLNGKKVELNTACALQLQQGFAQMYEVLLTHRNELATLLHMFAQDDVRVLFRNTVTYGHLLEEANHPSLLRDPAAMARHFSLLSMVIPDYQAAAKFVEFEIADMHRRDVPLFTTKADSHHLWYAKDACIPDFFEKSGFDRVQKKLATLSPQDLAHQTWVIAKALRIREDMLGTKPVQQVPSMLPGGDYDTPHALQQRLQAEALRVAQYIEQQVHVAGDYASWVVVKAASLDNRRMEVIPAFYDLYCGMPGEILFLTQMTRVTGDARYRLLAEQAFNTLWFKLGPARGIIRPLGLYVGWGGIIHMLTQLALLDDEARYFAQIEELFDSVDFDHLIDIDRSFALMKGAAGLVHACAEYARVSGSGRARQLAIRAARHLLEHRHPDFPGFAWKITSSVPLSGMAHGASGFALAFASLYRLTGEDEWQQAALQCLTYERSLYQEDMRNWRDCRDFAQQMSQGQVVCQSAWAHGSGGIGLARVALLQAGIDTPHIRAELEVALQTTFEQGFGSQHNLIFGSFGNLDLLLSATPFLPETASSRLQQHGRHIARLLMQEIDNGGWQFGEKNFHPLGLMAGVTGIGYQCLRMAQQLRQQVQDEPPVPQLPSILGGGGVAQLRAGQFASRMTA